MTIVADTSALVSLGVVADANWSPLDYILADHNPVLPAHVIDELNDTAACDDASGKAAKRNPRPTVGLRRATRQSR